MSITNSPDAAPAPDTNPIGGRPPKMACRVCGHQLSIYVNSATGQVTYLHPFRVEIDGPGHRPDPVPADTVDATAVCDFCTTDRIVYAFESGDLSMILSGSRTALSQQLGTDWAACLECADLVEARDVPGLLRRVSASLPSDALVSDATRELLQLMIEGLKPGRALADAGRWPAVALAPNTLPKVRDRLVRLLRGRDRLPLGLDQPQVRPRLADTLEAARLYWIDTQFTDLATTAAKTLPAVSIEASDLPAPHGLIAWAEPVSHLRIVAASWFSGPEGLTVVCYRSIGAGLDGVVMQRLRDQVGWIVPRHVRHLRPGESFTEGTPTAVLAATWLLIAQKLAEQVPVHTDKPIRKAYARTGRPAPDVRLVRLRGTTDDATSTAPRSDNAGSPDPAPREFRWWVRGHWRSQPYGPGRAQRRLIYIDPHTRGPQDKPIKPSTTVRILTGLNTPRPSTDG